MAFSASSLSGPLARKFSIGPVKIEIQSFSIASGDTTGTVTAGSLSNVIAAIPLGGAINLTALPTVSTNTASLAFVDPAATRYGYILLIGV